MPFNNYQKSHVTKNIDVTIPDSLSELAKLIKN